MTTMFKRYIIPWDSKSIMNILLTGASGTVGREVLAKLYEHNLHNLTVFDVDTQKTRKFYQSYKDRIKVVYGDISKKEEVEPHCKGIDFVIHLAAIIPPLADQNPDLAFRVNCQGTQNLVTSLELHAKNCFFLYASSVSVYGDRIENPMIRVADPLHASEGDEYAKTKIRAEEIIKASKLDWSIFRLTAIMGVGNHKTSGLMFHMPLSTPMEIATPEDAAKAFVNAIANKELLSKRVFNLGGGETCRIVFKEFLSQSFSIRGLGEPDFPPKSFAEKNFHCGYYADGDELEEILHFRKDTLGSYFQKVEKSVTPLRKFVTGLLAKFIKNHLLKQSEPYKAYQGGDQVLLNRFFK